MQVNNPDTDAVFQALTATFHPNPRSALLEIRRSGDEAVFVFRWTPDPHLYGVPVPLNQTTQRLDWDRPAADLNAGSIPLTSGSLRRSRTASSIALGVDGSTATSSFVVRPGPWTNASISMSSVPRTRMLGCECPLSSVPH